MDGIAVLKSAYAGAHMWYRGTIEGLTSEDANRVPPGIAHPIGQQIAHILHAEDGMLNMVLRGQPMLWERDGWGARLDLPLQLAQTSDSARAFRCDAQQLAQLGEYADAVFANTDAYLDSLTPDDLDAEADLTAAGMGTMPLGVFLTQFLLGNTYGHTGEISTLKGMLGRTGYPF
ncbi:MAG TPA: DinB family protein [Thermomicrobiales bacterium]|nr:DinB family protein [Thermomicrobiales bacterium]